MALRLDSSTSHTFPRCEIVQKTDDLSSSSFFLPFLHVHLVPPSILSALRSTNHYQHRSLHQQRLGSLHRRTIVRVSLSNSSVFARSLCTERFWSWLFGFIAQSLLCLPILSWPPSLRPDPPISIWPCPLLGRPSKRPGARTLCRATEESY